MDEYPSKHKPSNRLPSFSQKDIDSKAPNLEAIFGQIDDDDDGSDDEDNVNDNDKDDGSDDVDNDEGNNNNNTMVTKKSQTQPTSVKAFFQNVE